jgi:hypothetical protein
VLSLQLSQQPKNTIALPSTLTSLNPSRSPQTPPSQNSITILAFYHVRCNHGGKHQATAKVSSTNHNYNASSIATQSKCSSRLLCPPKLPHPHTTTLSSYDVTKLDKVTLHFVTAKVGNTDGEGRHPTFNPTIPRLPSTQFFKGFGGCLDEIFFA